MYPPLSHVSQLQLLVFINFVLDPFGLVNMCAEIRAPRAPQPLDHGGVQACLAPIAHSSDGGESQAEPHGRSSGCCRCRWPRFDMCRLQCFLWFVGDQRSMPEQQSVHES